MVDQTVTIQQLPELAGVSASARVLVSEPDGVEGTIPLQSLIADSTRTFKTRAEMRLTIGEGAALLLEAGYQGTFSWTAGNFTGAIDGFNIVESAGTPVGVGAWVRQNATGVVNLRNCGAVGNGVTDDTAAFAAAEAACSALKLPLEVPTGRYILNRTIRLQYGIIGHASALTRISVTNAAPFAGGKPLIHLGWTRAESEALCFAIPCRGFSLFGAGIRTLHRSSDPASMGFQGNGLFLDEQTRDIDINDVHTEFFFRNVDFGGVYGHLSATNLVSANGWYNIYFSRNSYDYKLYNATITGALFACIGASGTRDPALEQAVGGLAGLTMFGGHLGFGPYGIVIEGGAAGKVGTIGLRACTFIDARLGENVGNRAIWIVDAGKNSGILEFKSQGHSWARDGNNNPDAQYAIIGDGNYVAQDYAVVLGNIGGDSAPSYRRGVQWAVGSSGKHTKLGQLLDFWHDDRGIDGYEVESGIERLIYAGKPCHVATAAVAKNTVINGAAQGEYRLAIFDVPEAYDGTPLAVIALGGVVAASTDVLDVQLRIRVNGGQSVPISAFTLIAGQNSLPSEAPNFPIGRRAGGVHTVEVLLFFSVAATLTLNNKQLDGQVRMILGQTGVLG